MYFYGMVTYPIIILLFFYYVIHCYIHVYHASFIDYLILIIMTRKVKNIATIAKRLVQAMQTKDLYMSIIELRYFTLKSFL